MGDHTESQQKESRQAATQEALQYGSSFASTGAMISSFGSAIGAGIGPIVDGSSQAKPVDERARIAEQQEAIVKPVLGQPFAAPHRMSESILRDLVVFTKPRAHSAQ